MTIKHTNKNISAENEDVIIDVVDDINGVISFKKKNLHDDSNEIESIDIDLSKHKLNLIEKSVSGFNEMVSSTNKDSFYTKARLAENKSGIFLVPSEQNGEGIYEEYIWGVIDDPNNYKNTDYIDSDNIHYNFISLQSMNINLEPIRSEINAKLDKTDVIDNLTTNNASKALSAKQGIKIQNILDKLGLEKESIDKFNFAVIQKGEAPNLVYKEFWILVNADYNYQQQKFVKLDKNYSSFGIQLQASGTYPGEESIDNANTGINLWRHPKSVSIAKDNSIYNYNDNYIGAEKKSNGEWVTFGIAAGWTNTMMLDSYGGITVGGAGIEVDGNGISPFGRLTHSSYTITDESDTDHHYYLFGLIDNGYHPTQWGGWGIDTTTQSSWFIGLKSPEKNGGYLTKDTEQTTFVVMYNDKEDYSSNVIDPSKWNILFEVGLSGIKSSIFNNKNIVAEDFEITYDDDSDPETISILTLNNN